MLCRAAVAIALALALGAIATAEQPALDPEFAAIVNRPIVLTLPGMDQAIVRSDLPYKPDPPDPNLLMDVYLPGDLPPGERRPAVIFVHGGTATAARPKDWGIYQSWGRLAAASGLAGVTFTHRLGFPRTALAEGAADLADAIAYLRAHAEELAIDPDRLCLAAYSAGGPLLAPYLSSPPSFLRCAVAFYAFLDVRQSDLHREHETPEALDRFSPIVQIAARPETVPPIFIARAGRDEIPTLADSIDRFLAEAVRLNLPIDFHNHPDGVHGFDNQTDDERSREIVALALDFLQRHLRE